MYRLLAIPLVLGFLPGLLLPAQNPLPGKGILPGVVKQVDLEVGTITLRPSLKGTVADETRNLSRKDIDVSTPAGQKLSPKALAAGQTVQLKLGLTGDVEAVVVQNPAFLGTVQAVDPLQRTVTLSDGDSPRVLPVDPQAKVWLAGRTAFLREIKPGSRMSVATSLDGRLVQELTLVSDPDGKLATKLYTRIKTTRLPGTRLTGVLTDIDAAKGEVHLAGPKTKGVAKPLSVAKQARVQLLYSQVPVQDLPLEKIPNKTFATVLVTQQEITRILLEPAVVRATVKSLDAEQGKLVVVLEGQEKSFTLPRDLKVMDKTRVLRLGDLKPAMPALLILSLDREQLLAIDLELRQLTRPL